jgi:CubicO group peptidase (beta-lactamase class C family)
MKTLIPLLILFSLIGCNQKQDSSYKVPVENGDGLNVSTLNAHQFDAKAFEAISKDIYDGKYGKLHAVLMIHKGDLIAEQYYNGWKSEELHYMASTTKSFSAILTGIAIDKGKIEDVNQAMIAYFQDYPTLKTDSLKTRITIKNLLNNASGFAWDEQSLPVDNPNNMGVQMDKLEDWLNASLELPMETMPGTKYVYSGPNNIIVGEIIKRASGKNVEDFAAENLFKPLGITEYHWFVKNGICDLGGGLKLKCRDIAKYALMHLNKGKWKDKQVVSSEWIEETFEPRLVIKHPRYSCFQWQMVKTEYGFDSWYIPGNGGQIINVVPELDLVIVINADNKRISKNQRTPLEYLMKRLTEMHPEVEVPV